jgi:hypothetical protein
VNNTRRQLIVSSSGASKGTPLPPPQYVSLREKKLKTWGEKSKSCAECHKTWDTLKFIMASSHLPWVCIGDFNEVLHRNEHMGVCKNATVHGLQAFVKRLMCAVCLTSVMRGGKWTFEKKVAGGVLCHVRLDRALATADWH